MPHNSIISVWMLFHVLILLVTLQAAHAKEQINSSSQICVQEKACHICNSDERQRAECEKTGKIEVLSCFKYGIDNHESDKTLASQSCNRTEEDEEFLVIRLQMVCVLMGGIALMSVRKQKAANASLFDQRKRQSRQVVDQKAKDLSRKMNGSDRNMSIELTPLSEMDGDNDELTALTDSRPLEII